MTAARRFLPPIHLLSAFEAAARHDSITQAAAELSLTQGAVSRQILNLEEQLGISLFERKRKRLYLTAQGAQYLAEIRPALNAIINATVSLTANPGGGILNLSILPTFGTHWLAPKLADFLTSNPGITLNLGTHLEPFAFPAPGIDAAIFHGSGYWPGTSSLKLLDEQIVPACSRELMDRHHFENPQDLLQAPLLSLGTRPDAWKNWLGSHGVKQAPPGSMLFDQFATLAQATKHSMGIALLPLFLIEDDLESGKLVPACGSAESGDGAYYLVWPDNRSSYMPVKHFIQWISRYAEAG